MDGMGANGGLVRGRGVSRDGRGERDSGGGAGGGDAQQASASSGGGRVAHQQAHGRRSAGAGRLARRERFAAVGATRPGSGAAAAGAAPEHSLGFFGGAAKQSAASALAVTGRGGGERRGEGSTGAAERSSSRGGLRSAQGAGAGAASAPYSGRAASASARRGWGAPSGRAAAAGRQDDQRFAWGLSPRAGAGAAAPQRGAAGGQQQRPATSHAHGSAPRSAGTARGHSAARSRERFMSPRPGAAPLRTSVYDPERHQHRAAAAYTSRSSTAPAAGGPHTVAHPLAAGVWSRSSTRRFAKAAEPQYRVAKSAVLGGPGATHAHGAEGADGAAGGASASPDKGRLQVSGVGAGGPAGPQAPAVAWGTTSSPSVSPTKGVGKKGVAPGASPRQHIHLPEDGEELTEQASFTLSDYMRQLETTPASLEMTLEGAERRRWSGRPQPVRSGATGSGRATWSAGAIRPDSARRGGRQASRAASHANARGDATVTSSATSPESRSPRPAADADMLLYGFEGSSGDEVALDVASISSSARSSPTRGLDPLAAMARSNISDLRPATQGGETYGTAMAGGSEYSQAAMSGADTKQVDLSGMSANLFYAGDEDDEDELSAGESGGSGGDGVASDDGGARSRGRPPSQRRPPNEALFLFTNTTPEREHVAAQAAEAAGGSRDDRQIFMQRPGTVTGATRPRSAKVIRSPRKRDGPIPRKAYSARPPSRQRPPPQALTLELPPDGFGEHALREAAFAEIYQDSDQDTYPPDSETA